MGWDHRLSRSRHGTGRYATDAIGTALVIIGRYASVSTSGYECVSTAVGTG